MNEIIGWASSGILLVTLILQIDKQRRHTREGVSKWLFIGQLATSIGFVIYSVGTGNAVFIVTNSLIGASAVVGIYIFFTSPKSGSR